NVVLSGSTYIAMFARGFDNQIWQANYSPGIDTWYGWWQIPPPPGDSFVGSPGAAVYAIANGDEEPTVCARLASNGQLACTYVDEAGPDGGWTPWYPVSPVSGEPNTYKPALARGYSSVDLFGIRVFEDDSSYEETNGCPLGTDYWSAGWS